MRDSSVPPEEGADEGKRVCWGVTESRVKKGDRRERKRQQGKGRLNKGGRRERGDKYKGEGREWRESRVEKLKERMIERKWGGKEREGEGNGEREG